jgi:superfamily I DNA and/or RNA helicase
MASAKVRKHHIGQLTGFQKPEYLSDYHESIVDPSEPFIFVNVAPGIENRIKDSFSYFNKLEVEAAADVANLFLQSRLFPQDIGIISPYDQQVGQLKTRLNNTEIEIKTVDGFQGREKEVIIISLVRANEEGNLGFLTDYRRLNVALTRAKRKLILIGNIKTLDKDPVYHRLLDQVKIVSPPENGIS